MPPKQTTCKTQDCTRAYHAHGYCQHHYNQSARAKRAADTSLPRCSVDECPNRAESKGYCHKHYARLKRHGHPEIKTTREARKMDDDEDFNDSCTATEECYNIGIWNTQQGLICDHHFEMMKEPEYA